MLEEGVFFEILWTLSGGLDDSSSVREVLLGIRTVAEMVEAFRAEKECRQLLEVMVWPNRRVLLFGVWLQAFDRARRERDMGQYWD